MYRIILSADGIRKEVGTQAAKDIAEAFAARPWHKNVTCMWDEANQALLVEAENEYDNDGLALQDEFSDEISANIKNAGDGNLRVISIEVI